MNNRPTSRVIRFQIDVSQGACLSYTDSFLERIYFIFDGKSEDCFIVVFGFFKSTQSELDGFARTCCIRNTA